MADHVIPAEEWGAGPFTSGLVTYPPRPPLYLHHTVTAFIEPEEETPDYPRPPHLGILWHGDKEPTWAGKAKILRRHRQPHVARGGGLDGQQVPGISKWNQMEVRRRGGGLGYVVVQIDPQRVAQLEAKKRADRATRLASVLRVKALEARAMRQMDAYHRSLGWAGIGYRKVSFPSGRTYWGRGDRYGAHCPGANHLPSHAMAGNFAKRIPGVRLRTAVLADAGELGAGRIVGHRQHPHPTTCPGVPDSYITGLNDNL